MSASSLENDSFRNRSSQFATTHWSVVLSAGRKTSPEAKEALAKLWTIYWYPLYAYARRLLGKREDAQDAAQAFIAHLLEKESLRFADRTRGRFRSFLLASFKNFLAHQRDRAKAQKRGGSLKLLPTDFSTGEHRYNLEPADLLTPERIYERRWALTLLDTVLARLRKEHVDAHKLELFESLKPTLTGESGADGYAEIASRLRMTEGAVRVAAHRLRRRYAELLREEIAHTVGDPSEVDDEIRQLFSALGSK